MTSKKQLIQHYKRKEYGKVVDLIQNIKRDENNSTFLNKMLGACYTHLNDFESAENCYLWLANTEPENEDAHYNLGTIYRKIGQIDKAIKFFKRAIDLNPQNVEALYNYSNCLISVGREIDAEFFLQKAIELNPKLAKVHNNLGVIFENQGDYDKAKKYYENATQLEPKIADYYYNLANIHYILHELLPAEINYRVSLELHPDNVKAHNNLGLTQRALGKSSEAITSHKKALSLMGIGDTDLLNNLAIALKDAGLRDEAVLAYKSILEIDPQNTDAHRKLSLIYNYNQEKEHFDQLVDLSKVTEMSPSQKSELYFALAKAHADRKAFDLAFDCFKIGNANRKKALNYCIDTDRRLFRQIEKYLSTIISPRRLELSGHGYPIPIFIVGMPRSGTTLIEQIISSHPLVAGLGELPYIPSIFSAIYEKYNIFNYECLEYARIKYIEKIKTLETDTPYFTDKLPHNFLYLPLIALAFPEAKIIHVFRDARATCWSNYTHFFPSEGLGFTNDLYDIIVYYKMYQKLIAKWKMTYSSRIHEVNYDELTLDKEQSIRNLIGNIGLDWNPLCLSPHLNSRSVSTASQSQVRLPIYGGSSKAWKNYEPFIGDLLDF